MLGLWVEFTHPGVVFPGVAGAVCLLLGLYAMSVLPINYAGLALIFLGVIMFILEVKVVSAFDNMDMKPESMMLSDKPVEKDSVWKPGSYKMIIEHTGYQTRQDDVEITPGVGAFPLEYKLVPDDRPVRINIKFDVEPGEIPLGPAKVLFRNAKGETFRVHTGDQLTPGEYHVHVEKDDAMIAVGQGNGVINRQQSLTHSPFAAGYSNHMR